MGFINTRIVKIDLSGIEAQLKRLNDNIEEIHHIGRRELIPNVDFDPDDYSSVLYTNEEDELIKQHLARRVAGIDVGL